MTDLARYGITCRVFDLLFSPNHQEDTAGSVLPVRIEIKDQEMVEKVAGILTPLEEEDSRQAIHGKYQALHQRYKLEIRPDLGRTSKRQS